MFVFESPSRKLMAGRQLSSARREKSFESLRAFDFAFGYYLQLSCMHQFLLMDLVSCHEIVVAKRLERFLGS